ncbi:hypothetical protein HPB52_013490 [Rhipicephalus sanguineus]|uniref:Uncharacterized protein n=1 Tax=Rhipicephalus sanguineus TaxID=34632 RepID=A0A9D4PD26_RHISA|nr:hypothetical protein HPB52_013490 [Rhipicephalus sanguineus]
MTSQSDFGSSEFRCGPCEHSVPSLRLKSIALADVRRFDASGEQKVFPYENRYCEPYQPHACSPPSDKDMRRYSQSEASRSYARSTAGGVWYLRDSAPVDVNCGLFSPPSRHAELCSGDLDSEPFDACELVARETAVAANYQDADLKESTLELAGPTPEQPSPAKSPFPSMPR